MFCPSKHAIHDTCMSGSFNIIMFPLQYIQRNMHMFVMLYFNTLRSRQNGHHFADDSFKCIFLNENLRISNKIQFKLVPNGPINNIWALVQIMAWRRPSDKPYLNQWWLDHWRIYVSLGLKELILVDCTYVVQDLFTGTRAIVWSPVKQPWRIWVNESQESA